MSSEEQKIKQRLAAQKSRQKHKNANRVKAKKQREERREYLLGLLGTRCNRCGFTPINENEYCVLDFHHINQANKSFDISSSLLRQLPALIDEVNKCELLCANCHRIETRFNPGSKGCKIKNERAPINQYPRQTRTLSQDTKNKIAASMREYKKAHPIKNVLSTE